MADLITYTDKVDLFTSPVAEINKVTAANMNQIKASINFIKNYAPIWVKIQKSAADYSIAATNSEIELIDLSDDYYFVHQILINVTQGFSGGTVSAATIDVGIVFDNDKYTPSPLDVTTIGSYQLNNEYIPDAFDGVSIVSYLTTTGGNIDSLDEGIIDFYLLISKLPV